MTDNCICEGNWRSLVKEYEPLMGQLFVDRHGERWQFYGLVWGGDDFYYGMYSDKDKCVLLSCVGDLTGHGYELISGSSVGRAVDC